MKLSCSLNVMRKKSAKNVALKVIMSVYYAHFPILHLRVENWKRKKDFICKLLPVVEEGWMNTEYLTVHKILESINLSFLTNRYALLQGILVAYERIYKFLWKVAELVTKMIKVITAKVVKKGNSGMWLNSYVKADFKANLHLSCNAVEGH